MGTLSHLVADEASGIFKYIIGTAIGSKQLILELQDKLLALTVEGDSQNAGKFTVTRGEETAKVFTITFCSTSLTELQFDKLNKLFFDITNSFKNQKQITINFMFSNSEV